MSIGVYQGQKSGGELAVMDDESDVSPVSSLDLAGRAEIDIQVSTGRKYPRSPQSAFNEAVSLVTLTPRIAATCTYALKRGGKTITGKSVRLAEMVASAWGNLRTTGRIVSENSRFIVAEGVCLDVQKNIGFAVQVHRRITYSDGRKYNDDMVATTGNAAISIAVRNAIFRVVPGAFSEAVWDAAQACAAGDLKGLEERRGAAIGFFVKKGVTEARIFGALGVVGMADIDLNALMILEGFRTSLKESSATLEELFPEDEPASSTAKGSKALLGEITGKGKAKGAKAAESQEPLIAAEDVSQELPMREPGE